MWATDVDVVWKRALPLVVTASWVLCWALVDVASARPEGDVVPAVEAETKEGEGAVPGSLPETFSAALTATEARYVKLRDAALARPQEARSFLQKKLQSTQWQERLLAQIWLAWLEHGDEYRRFLANYLPPEADLLDDLAPEDTAILIEALWKRPSDFWRTRQTWPYRRVERALVLLLAIRHDTRAIPFLEARLADNSRGVRWSLAARGLRDLGSKESVPALLKALAKAPYDEGIAGAILTLTDPKEWPALPYPLELGRYIEGYESLKRKIRQERICFNWRVLPPGMGRVSKEEWAEALLNRLAGKHMGDMVGEGGLDYCAPMYRKVAEDEAVPEGIRLRALFSLLKMESEFGLELKGNADWAYDYYNKTFGGRDQRRDMEAHELRWLNLYHEGASYSEKCAKQYLDEGLAAVATWEKATGKVGTGLAAFHRAELYYYAKRWKEAMAYYETFLGGDGIDDVARLVPAEAHLARCQVELGQPEKAWGTFVQGLNRYPPFIASEEYGVPPMVDVIGTQEILNLMSVLLFKDSSPLGTDKFASVFSEVSANAEAVSVLFSKQIRTSLFDPDGTIRSIGSALSWARLGMEASPYYWNVRDDFEDCVRECTGRNQEYAKVSLDEFRSYWYDGPAGKDGKPGTDDDLRDVVALVPRPKFSAAAIARIQRELDAALPRRGRVWWDMNKRATLYLTLGRFDDALRAVIAAYRVAPRKYTSRTPRPDRVLHARTHTQAGAVAEWLHWGATGPWGGDRKPGTADDQVRPTLPAMPPFPASVKAALESLAHVKGDSLEAILDRGRARLALGDIKGGLSEMLKAQQIAADDSVARERAANGVAAAIKAHDMSDGRARLYLDYLKYGPAGKDGKKNTPDDLIDPLPFARRELGL